MRGYGNDRVIREVGGEYRGEAISVVRFPLVVSDLPYLLDSPGEGFQVEGEIYRIPQGGWETLDRFEGHPHFYRRRVERFAMGADDRIVTAWVYFVARASPDLRRMKTVKRFEEAGDVKDIT